jgi:hypothetical protein
MWPVAWTARGDGASLFKDRCVRVTYISRQSTTHITESREVLCLYGTRGTAGRYGLSNADEETKNGAAICQCGLSLSQARDSRAR